MPGEHGDERALALAFHDDAGDVMGCEPSRATVVLV